MSQYTQSYRTTSYTSSAPVAQGSASYQQASYSSSATSGAGLTDVAGAKAIAKKLFESFDKSKKGKLEGADTVPMIQESVKSFNTYYNPSAEEQAAFLKTIDRNGDGVATLSDLEDLCVRYLTSGEETVKKAKNYTEEVQARLDVARRLFKRYDKDGSGVLQDDEIAGLLKDTYAEMGMANFTPTKEDVKIWLQMADANADDEVTLEEYEDLVIKSLAKSGIRIEKQSLVF